MDEVDGLNDKRGALLRDLSAAKQDYIRRFADELKGWYLPEAERVIAAKHEAAMQSDRLSDLKVELQKRTENATNLAHSFADNPKFWPHETGAKDPEIDVRAQFSPLAMMTAAATGEFVLTMQKFGLDAKGGVATFSASKDLAELYNRYAQGYGQLKKIDQQIVDARTALQRQAAVEKWRKA